MGFGVSPLSGSVSAGERGVNGVAEAKRRGLGKKIGLPRLHPNRDARLQQLAQHVVVQPMPATERELIHLNPDRVDALAQAPSE